MNQGITYRDFNLSIEIITSGTGVEKVERRTFLADRGDHKIYIPIKGRSREELEKIAKKKIDNYIKTAY